MLLGQGEDVVRFFHRFGDRLFDQNRNLAFDKRSSHRKVLYRRHRDRNDVDPAQNVFDALIGGRVRVLSDVFRPGWILVHDADQFRLIQLTENTRVVTPHVPHADHRRPQRFAHQPASVAVTFSASPPSL